MRTKVLMHNLLKWLKLIYLCRFLIKLCRDFSEKPKNSNIRDHRSCMLRINILPLIVMWRPYGREVISNKQTLSWADICYDVGKVEMLSVILVYYY